MVLLNIILLIRIWLSLSNSELNLIQPLLISLVVVVLLSNGQINQVVNSEEFLRLATCRKRMIYMEIENIIIKYNINNIKKY